MYIYIYIHNYSTQYLVQYTQYTVQTGSDFPRTPHLQITTLAPGDIDFGRSSILTLM